MNRIRTKDIQTIQRGSQLLKECAKLLDMDNKEFRDQLFSGTVSLDSLNPQQKQFIEEEAIPAINDVKHIEGRVIRDLGGLIYKLAMFASNKVRSPIMDLDDFRQDATFAVSEAIFGYSDPDKSKFITYVSRCIQNRLSKSLNTCNPFCPLTNEALALLRAVDETRQNLNRPTNLDEIFEILGLTEEQRSTVRHAQVSVNEENYLAPQEARFNDYTQRRRNLDLEKDTVPCNYELHEAMERADLTDVEQHAIEAYMDDYYGWQEDVASQHINPKTGVRYTRANIPFILDRAFKKIQRAYCKK